MLLKSPAGERRWWWIRSSAVAVLVISFAAAFVFFVLSAAAAATDEDLYFPNPPDPILTAAIAPSSSSSSPGPTNISHILFSIAASSATWHARKPYSDLWWDPSLMRGQVWLDAEPTYPWPSISPPYRLSSSDVTLFGDRATASRIARIAAEAYELGMEDIRWYVMGDDDTVFFPDNLVEVLRKYDHREMYYIGAPSESVEQDQTHSYSMAFGGGGFVLSAPAAAALAPAIDGCLERYNSAWGSDERVKFCLSEIGVPLTTQPGFHQVDLRGDLYGMLAAHPVAPLLSLHHLDNVKPIFPGLKNQIDSLKMMVRASKFDPSRILQQTFCYHSKHTYNWSLSISWGYTVQIYPYVLPPKDLEVPLRTFETWRSFKDGPFLFNTRELQAKCEWPEIFFLDRVKKLSRNLWTGTVSEYSRYKPGSGQRCDKSGFVAASKIGSIRVTASKMNPNVWQKAPRRQCCDTRQTRRHVLDVRIRDCYAGEITTPP